jgi:DMSO/TMAO reductase YedYZ molybdopterin-dependent catalytic subunit
MAYGTSHLGAYQMSKLKLLIVLVIAVGILSMIFLNFSTMLPYETFENVNVWSLRVDGLVQNPLNLTLDELTRMPRTTVNAVLYCVDFPNKPVAEGNWTGVRLSLLLEKVKVSQDAIKIALTADDGYTTDIDLATAMRDDVILAYELNGKPLPEKLCLVVPGKWGYKWISSVSHIEFVNFDFKGLWESRGYSDEADIP